MSLQEFLSIKKVLICVGSGGVGKTTTAASIAVKIARMGRRVMVCTIDPARRLATSLGIPEVGNEETKVADYGEGSLSALMLDVKATFDSVVDRYAEDEAARQRIHENRYYQHVSQALSVSQEFMAIEKLYELSESGRYDVIVLDTPPTKNTVDFLKTPELIVSAMDDRFTKWLMKPYIAMKEKRGLGIAAFAAERVFQGLGRVFGMDALTDVAEFVHVMQGMIAGFRERAGRVRELITDISTGFIVVAAARERSVEEALYFFKEIEGIEGDVIAIVLNRLLWPQGAPPSAELEAWLALLPEELQAPARADVARIVTEGEREVEVNEHLARTVPAEIIQRIPQFDEDIHDLPGLERYSEQLR